MHFNNGIAARTLFTILSITALLFLSGCATQRWTDPLTKEHSKAIEEVVSTMQQRQNLCPKSLDADARIFMKSPLADSAIKGYLVLAAPSSIKFIVTNPLGMLAYAFTSDGTNFQILNTGKRLHIRGRITSLALREKIPLMLTQGDWFAYLNQRLPSNEPAILQITKDVDDSSYWLQLGHSANITTDGSQWLHLDAKQQRVLGYLFLDRAGEVVAEISYAGEAGETGQEKNICFPAARSILIDKLSWGTEIRIELQDIGTDIPLNDSEFNLPVPVDYFKQIQP